MTYNKITYKRFNIKNSFDDLNNNISSFLDLVNKDDKFQADPIQEMLELLIPHLDFSKTSKETFLEDFNKTIKYKKPFSATEINTVLQNTQKAIAQVKEWLVDDSNEEHTHAIVGICHPPDSLNHETKTFDVKEFFNMLLKRDFYHDRRKHKFIGNIDKTWYCSFFDENILRQLIVIKSKNLIKYKSVKSISEMSIYGYQIDKDNPFPVNIILGVANLNWNKIPNTHKNCKVLVTQLVPQIKVGKSLLNLEPFYFMDLQKAPEKIVIHPVTSILAPLDLEEGALKQIRNKIAENIAAKKCYKTIKIPVHSQNLIIADEHISRRLNLNLFEQ